MQQPGLKDLAVHRQAACLNRCVCERLPPTIHSLAQSSQDPSPLHYAIHDTLEAQMGTASASFFLQQATTVIQNWSRYREQVTWGPSPAWQSTMLPPHLRLREHCKEVGDCKSQSTRTPRVGSATTGKTRQGSYHLNKTRSTDNTS